MTCSDTSVNLDSHAKNILRHFIVKVSHTIQLLKNSEIESSKLKTIAILIFIKIQHINQNFYSGILVEGDSILAIH